MLLAVQWNKHSDVEYLMTKQKEIQNRVRDQAQLCEVIAIHYFHDP